MAEDTGRVVVWFSRGAASAVAAKVATKLYRHREVWVCYCAGTEKDEHPDGERFQEEVAHWIGTPIKKLYHPKYNSITEVWEGERYIAGVNGASCTRALKRRVRESFQQPGDTHVFGLTADERSRVIGMEEDNPDLKFAWLLASAGITKADCYRILQAAEIALPVMYSLGFNNNNCIGCCKGGMGYWNKVRRLFPDIYDKRAETFRGLGVRPFQAPDGTRFGLDELHPDAGRDDEPDIECGLFCDRFTTLVDLAVTRSEGGQHVA